MTKQVRVADFITTKKQREFERDFFKGAEDYQRWEDVEFGKVWENELRFTVETEDILAFSAGVSDDNPLFCDEEAAKCGPFGGLTAHPLFLTPIAFWLAGDSGPASWIRTPGAINPGSEFELYEPIRPGDTLRSRTQVHDKWIKRGKRYLTYQLDLINQDDTVVVRVWVTLILPTSQGDEVHRF